MSKRTRSPELFARWLWLVYMPLALFVVLAVLRVAGVLPGWANILLILSGLYGLVALKLLVERKRTGMGIPLPRNLMTGLAAISGILVLGVIFFILGVERLSSSGGLAMALLGGFLMILSVTVPTFRLVDKMLRFGGRFIGQAGGRQKAASGQSQKPDSDTKPAGRAPKHSAKTPGRPGRP